MGKIKKRAGFTLIEVMIAIFILIIIIGSVLMLLSSSYASLRESEAKNIAKNIGSYTVEFIRSRNVTYPDNPLKHTPSEFGNDDSYYFPGLIDLWDSPSTSNPSPLKPTNSASDTINIHPTLPSQNYNTTAFYSSIQGYVSLTDNPADSDPSSEDGNAKVVLGKYYDKQTGAPYVVKFPLNSSDPDAIKNFSAGSTYIPMIYTADPIDPKLDPARPEYDPHYTNTIDKSKTMDYNGFRVLTSIAARAKKANPSDPDPTHVQYYDVKVTVLWVTGGDEHEYSLATQIVTYGGG